MPSTACLMDKFLMLSTSRSFGVRSNSSVKCGFQQDDARISQLRVTGSQLLLYGTKYMQ